MHIGGEDDANVGGATGGALRITAENRTLQIDTNEILATTYYAPTSLLPAITLASTLYLNREGGEIILHDAVSADARVSFHEDGRVVLGQEHALSAKLTVDGAIRARELYVTPDGWADDVFEPGYPMRSIAELEAYVKKHRHLPSIPSEREVTEEGVSVGEMDASLLRNVEELTLRLIALSQRVDEATSVHAKRVAELEKRAVAAEQRLAELEARAEALGSASRGSR